MALPMIKPVFKPGWLFGGLSSRGLAHLIPEKDEVGTPHPYADKVYS